MRGCGSTASGAPLPWQEAVAGATDGQSATCSPSCGEEWRRLPSTIPTATLASRSRCAGSLGLARGAIDTFDIAAHLEASGVGDRAAQRLGHVDVFAWAADLITTEPDPAPAATRTARRERRTASRVTLPPDTTASIPASMFRVTTLLAGMALCAVVLAGHTTSTTDTLLGLSSTAVLGSGGCWLVSHAVSAAVWHDRGLGDGRIGRSAVVPLALGLLLAVAISIFDPAAAWWIGYGAASGVVIARQDSWRIALSAVGVALLSLLAHLLAPAVGGLLARGAVVVAVVAAVAMVSTARPTGRDVTDPAAWAVIASATLQTCAQVGALFCLLGWCRRSSGCPQARVPSSWRSSPTRCSPPLGRCDVGSPRSTSGRCSRGSGCVGSGSRRWLSPGAPECW